MKSLNILSDLQTSAAERNRVKVWEEPAADVMVDRPQRAHGCTTEVVFYLKWRLYFFFITWTSQLLILVMKSCFCIFFNKLLLLCLWQITKKRVWRVWSSWISDVLTGVSVYSELLASRDGGGGAFVVNSGVSANFRHPRRSLLWKTHAGPRLIMK